VRISKLTRPTHPGSLPGRAGLVGPLGLGALDGRRRVADRDRDAARLALLGLRDVDLEDAVVEVGLDGVGVDTLREGQAAREAAERALDAVVALVLVRALGLALARDGERRILTSSCVRPGRSARSTKSSAVSTRSIAGTQRRIVAPSPGVVGVSKAVVNSRFISFWSELSSRSGSQRTIAIALSPFTTGVYGYAEKSRISVASYQVFLSRPD
jgi:hypothetical protein